MTKWKGWKPKTNKVHQVVFYLPSKRSNGEPLGVDRDRLVHATMCFLLHELGGCTQVEGIGYFTGDGRKLHIEQSTLCRSFCSKEDLEKHGPEINRLANSLAIEFEQESLAVELDNVMYFFGPTRRYREVYAYLKFKWGAGEGEKSGYEKYIAKELPAEVGVEK